MENTMNTLSDTYRYSFDHSRAGDFYVPRDKYELERDALKHLLAKVQELNETALLHGAIEVPYRHEVSRLRHLISYAEEGLKDKASDEIFLQGVSVGSLQYIKAALVYSIRTREAEIARKLSESWPSIVVDNLRVGLQRLRDHANAIKYPPCDLLAELRLDSAAANTVEERWDVFISHASEDKDAFVRPFARALREAGLRVWYDEFTLSLGDSLRRSIDRGLARSRFGIVVLSPSFFAKDWPQRELDGLVGLEVEGRKVILPLWHNIDLAGVRGYSPTLADRVAGLTSQPMNELVASVLSVVRS